MQIANITNHIAFCEAQGLAKCFQAYANFSAGEEIMQIGFNPNSGYTYIALENGVTICSSFGLTVQYLFTDFGDGEEHFFNTYEEALYFDPYTADEEETESAEYEHPEHDEAQAERDSDLNNIH
jgi:hypothetical protein